jgi:hypothetical protein
MISIVASVMNRTDRVVKCVSSWCGHDKVSDFVLVDWSSSPPIKEDEGVSALLAKNPKIKLIEVRDQEYFSLPRSYNIGIDAAAGPKVLKVDIDYVMTNPALMEYLDGLDLSLKFYTGQLWNPVFSGMFFFEKRKFKECEGYCEQFEGWGRDDVDLYQRMAKKTKKVFMDDAQKQYIFHIPHDDNLRVANYKEKSKGASFRHNMEVMKAKKNSQNN